MRSTSALTPATLRTAIAAVLTDVASTVVPITIESRNWDGDLLGCTLAVPGASIPPAPEFGVDPTFSYAALAFNTSQTSTSEARTYIANEAQTLVQVALWQRHADPTWPPCPAHVGHHPLRSRLDTDGHPLSVERAVWACMHHDAPTLVGSIADSAYVVEIGRWSGR